MSSHMVGGRRFVLDGPPAHKSEVLRRLEIAARSGWTWRWKTRPMLGLRAHIQNTDVDPWGGRPA